MAYCVDALVIGGGVQGLWILNDLIRRGFRSCLITDGPLGSGQTLKSHVYLHGGHLYENRELVQRISQAQSAWQKLLKAGTVQASSQRPIWILPSSTAGVRLESWHSRGLSFQEKPLPELFSGGELTMGSTQYRAFETQECWLNGETLISALSEKVLPAIRNGRVESIEIRGDRVQSVQVTLAKGPQVTFRPKFVVLAAGIGNQQLLDRAVSSESPEEDNRFRQAGASLQRVRASQMVVVRGRRLPPMGCIAPRKMFLVSQNDGADTVWMNSYEVDEVTPTVDPGSMPAVDPRRLKTSLDILHSVVPRIQSMDVRYGVYTGLKAERNVECAWVPAREYVEHLGRPSLNLRLVWPSKLTLAPLASERIVGLIGQAIRPNPRREALVTLPGATPLVGMSDWRTTACVPLDTLMARHGVN